MTTTVMRRKIISGFSALMLLVSTAAFAVDDAYVETDVNVPINIELAGLTGQPSPNINVPASTNAGGSLTTTASSTIFLYTPPNGYSGIDSFTYTVLNDVTGDPNGIITIQVGAVETAQVVQGSPSEALSNNIIAACNVNSSSGEIISTSLADLCANFAGATAAEKIRIASELAPKELGGQTQISSNLATQQIDGIRKRLASLRQGMSGFDVARLHIEDGTNAIALNQVLDLDKERGGAAGADGNQRLGGFVSGKVGNAEHNASEQEDGYTISNRALTFGSDYRFSSKTVAGVAIANHNDAMDIDDQGGSLDASGNSLIGYTSYYINDKTYVEAVWTFTKNHFDATRHINFTSSGTTIDKNASSSLSNEMLTASFGFGYETVQQHGLTLILSGNLDAIKTAFDGYAEDGAPGYNLVIEKREKTQVTSSIDANMTYPVSMANGVLVPQLSIMWKHAITDDAEFIQGYFKEDPDKNRFRFSTESPDKDYLKFNVGVSNILPGGNTGFLNYEQVFAKSGYSEYNLSLGMRFVF